MKLEFSDIRVVGGSVFADHPTLNTIDVTRYLTPECWRRVTDEAERLDRAMAEPNPYAAIAREERENILAQRDRQRPMYLDPVRYDEPLAMLGRVPGVGEG